MLFGFQVASAVFAVALLVWSWLVWRDPTLLYRATPLDRMTWGWLEGRRELPYVARVSSLILALLAVGLLLSTIAWMAE
jgi:hypothetical protein